MDLKDYLKKLDLDEKEIKTYLVCLEVGESSIVEIKEKSYLPRTTVYQILERLRDHGLLNIVETKSRRIYSPKPPEQVLTLLKNKKAKLEEEIDSFQCALPELRRSFNAHPFQPKVRFFPEKEIKEIYEDILNSAIDQAWFVSEFYKLQTVLGERYLKGWVERRVVKKIHSRVILVNSSILNDKMYLESKEYLRRTRYAPPNFSSPTHTMIYGDNVAIITTTGENFGTVITSREYADTMRSWFRLLWNDSSQKPTRRVPITYESE